MKLLLINTIALVSLTAPAFAQDTRTVTDDMGRTVDIPETPERVVFVGEEHAAMVTTLGYVPYAMCRGYSSSDLTGTLTAIGGDLGDLSEMIDLGPCSPPDFEYIAGLEPDLIIWWNDEELIGKLEQIAPTLGYNPRQNNAGDYGDAGGERYAKQRIIADLVGVEDQLDAAIATYEAEVVALRETHGAAIANLEYNFIDTGDTWPPHMYDPVRWFTFAYNGVMSDIGMTPAKSFADAGAVSLGSEEDNGYVQISLEVIPDYAADLMFVGRYDTDPLADDVKLVLDATEAAKAEQVFQVNSNIWTYHLLQAQTQVLGQVDAILSGGVENLGDF